MEKIVGEERTAVAVETIRATKTAGGIMFGNEEFQSDFFLLGEFVALAGRAVELGVLLNQSEQVLFQGFGERLGSDAGGMRFAEIGWVTRVGFEF